MTDESNRLGTIAIPPLDTLLLLGLHCEAILMTEAQVTLVAEKYAEGFARELKLDSKPAQKCEWSCLFWVKEHWELEAQKAQIRLQQAKQHLSTSAQDAVPVRSLFLDSQFKNTTAMVFAKLFDTPGSSCPKKDFPNCPFIDQRDELLRRGFLANTFMTILQKAVHFAMLETNPIDSGLIDEEYTNVYGIDLTDFKDLEKSLTDGRFEHLFKSVTKRASELAALSLSSNPVKARKPVANYPR